MNSRAVKLMLNKYVQVITLTFKRLIKKYIEICKLKDIGTRRSMF